MFVGVLVREDSGREQWDGGKVVRGEGSEAREGRGCTCKVEHGGEVRGAVVFSSDGLDGGFGVRGLESVNVFQSE